MFLHPAVMAAAVQCLLPCLSRQCRHYTGHLHCAAQAAEWPGAVLPAPGADKCSELKAMQSPLQYQYDALWFELLGASSVEHRFLWTRIGSAIYINNKS